MSVHPFSAVLEVLAHWVPHREASTPPPHTHTPRALPLGKHIQDAESPTALSTAWIGLRETRGGSQADFTPRERTHPGSRFPTSEDTGRSCQGAWPGLSAPSEHPRRRPGKGGERYRHSAASPGDVSGRVTGNGCLQATATRCVLHRMPGCEVPCQLTWHRGTSRPSRCSETPICKVLTK